MEPGDLGLLLLAEVAVQLVAERCRVEVGAQHLVDLGELAALQLEPALVDEVVQGGDHAAPAGIQVALPAECLQRREVELVPGTGAPRGIQDRLDEVTSLALEALDQGLGLAPQLEAVVGEIGVARLDDAA